MAKKIAYFLLAFVIAFAAGRGWMWARERAAKAPVQNARLIDCDPNQVRGIRVLRKDGRTLEFHRLDQPRPGVPAAAQLAMAQWRMTGNPETEADASVLSRIASMACDLYNPAPAEGVAFGESAGSAKSLELVTQKDGVAVIHSLDFGGFTANRQALVRYRAGVGDTGVQAQVTPKLLQLSSLEPDEYRNLKVLRFNGDQMMMVSLVAGKQERFTLERDGAGWSIYQKNRKIADGGERANQYVNRFGTLRALAAKPAAGVKCDALPYKFKLSFGGVGSRGEELFLDYDKSGPVRACNSARDSLFEVHRDLLQYVDVPAMSLTK
jgi:hypothetical protein